MGEHAQRRLGGGDAYYLVIAISLLVALVAFGGASRADELQQTAVRTAALAAIAAVLWPLDFSAFRNARGVIAAMACAYLLLLAQLVPMPPDLWSSMPGHGFYADLARETSSPGWRPWTLSPDLTINALGGLLPATAMGLAALTLDLHGRVRLAHWLVGLACLSALLGLVQFAAGGNSFHLFRTSSGDSAVGLFANRNHQAVLMACNLPLLAALATIHARERAEWKRILGWTAAIGALMLMALAATGSRMGLFLGGLGLASAAAIFRICARRTTALPIARSYWAAGFAIGLAALVPISILVARGGAVARLSYGQAIGETRLMTLRPMLDATWAFMPFGAGFGTFDPVFRRFEPNSLLSTIYLNQAHNEPVQLAIEGGVPALLLAAVFLIWWFRGSARAVRRRGSPVRRAMAISAVSATLILMLSSLVDYPLRTPLLSGLFAIACVELVKSGRKVQTSGNSELAEQT